MFINEAKYIGYILLFSIFTVKNFLGFTLFVGQLCNRVILTLTLDL